MNRGGSGIAARGLAEGSARATDDEIAKKIVGTLLPHACPSISAWGIDQVKAPIERLRLSIRAATRRRRPSEAQQKIKQIQRQLGGSRLASASSGPIGTGICP
jgi:hypothetical protein